MYISSYYQLCNRVQYGKSEAHFLLSRFPRYNFLYFYRNLWHGLAQYFLNYWDVLLLDALTCTMTSSPHELQLSCSGVMHFYLYDIKPHFYRTNCVDLGKYVPPDFCYFLGCKKMAKEAGLKLDVRMWSRNHSQVVSQ